MIDLLLDLYKTRARLFKKSLLDALFNILRGRPLDYMGVCKKMNFRFKKIQSSVKS